MTDNAAQKTLLRLPLLLLLGLIVPPLSADSSAVSTDVFTVDVSGAAASRVLESHHDVTRQSAGILNAVYYRRHQIADSPWYWGTGIRTDQYTFASREGFPINHLQDYAAQTGIEYMIDGMPAAAVIIRPGLYFQNEVKASAWDIPLDAVTGFPIRSHLNGVIGVSEARFYPRPIPVIGLSWTVNSRTRLDAVYPEPAINLDLNPALQARIGGRLIGGGFRADARTGLGKIEYYEYHTGLTLTAKIHPQVKLIGETGYSVERVFDFFDASRKLQANGAPYLHVGLEWSR